MVLMLARVIGIGIETADMLVHEVLMRNLRDRRAVARYAGITGAPNESGDKRREKGLSRAGNARVRRGLVQLAWRWLTFQKDSALAQWYRQRTVMTKTERIHTEYNQKLSLPCCLRDHIINPLDRQRQPSGQDVLHLTGDDNCL